MKFDYNCKAPQRRWHLSKYLAGWCNDLPQEVGLAGIDDVYLVSFNLLEASPNMTLQSPVHYKLLVLSKHTVLSSLLHSPGGDARAEQCLITDVGGLDFVGSCKI